MVRSVLIFIFCTNVSFAQEILKINKCNCKYYDFKLIKKWINFYNKHDKVLPEHKFNDSLIIKSLTDFKTYTGEGFYLTEDIKASAYVDAYHDFDTFKSGNILPSDTTLYTIRYKHFEGLDYLRTRFYLEKNSKIKFSEYVENKIHKTYFKLDSIQNNINAKLTNIYNVISFSEIRPSTINVACNLILTPCYIKFKYINAGISFDLSPLLLDCDELNEYEYCVRERNKYNSDTKVNFKYKNNKVYWITDILEFKLIQDGRVIDIYNSQEDDFTRENIIEKINSKIRRR